MNFPEVQDQVDKSSETIVIKDSLTYEILQPIIAQIIDKNIGTVKCENICEIDLTGIQFLQAIQKYSKDIIIETNFTNEVKNLLSKTGYHFKKRTMKKILVVDDSESIREIVSMTLVNEGYDVILGKDGQDALKKIENQNDLNLVITDLHMPNLDGIGLIREIRRSIQYARIPILFLTTETQMGKKIEAKEAGATGWIIKPFIPAKLLHAVSKVIK